MELNNMYDYDDFAELPIQCKEIKTETDSITYIDGEWKENFGPWKKNDKFNLLYLSFIDYKLAEFVKEKEIKFCFTKLVVDNRDE